MFGGTIIARGCFAGLARVASTTDRDPRRPGRRAFAVTSTALALFCATGACAAVPVPTVTGPITGPGTPFVTPPSGLNLAASGFVEQEYFVAGTARAHTAAGPLLGDGRWSAAADGDTAAYETRILVRRPARQQDFNGTVIVEWLNVSGGLDAAPDWTFVQTLIRREGYAWVGVSAQFVGVAGTGGPLGLNLSLKAVNPARYAPLVHPGDSFSYDIFSQAAEAIRHPDGPAPLGPLVPKRLIAVGESQSAFRFVTYVNAVHPLAQEYDGFLIHSRGGGAAPLSQGAQGDIATPTPTAVRDDGDVPVLIFETETDLITLGDFAARQPDEGNVRVWEVAGTSHDDAYGLSVGPNDGGRGAMDTSYLPPVTSIFGVIQCAAAINAGPQHYVENAALKRLTGWVRAGRVRGASAPRLQVSAGPPPSIDRDALGNALGGIRTPAVDVPVATLSGLGQTGGSFCSLFGTTTPLDPATLASRYPSHSAYVSAVRDDVQRAVRAGFILKPDARAIKEAALASDIGG
jgi:alpha/beta hydrolase family protein